MSNEIKIHFDNQSGVYHAGAQLTGCVSVFLAEEIGVSSIDLKLNGSLKVAWKDRRAEVGANETTYQIGATTVNVRENNNTDVKTVTTHFEAQKTLLDGKVILWNGEVMRAGSRNFRFRYTLPANLAPSFKNTHASIEYQCEAVIRRTKLLSFNIRSQSKLTILHNLDLAHTVPMLNSPLIFSNEKSVGALFWKSGQISAAATLQNRGLVAGQSLGLTVHVMNQSNTRIQIVKANLMQIVMATAKAQAPGKAIHGAVRTQETRKRLYEWTSGSVSPGHDQVFDFTSVVVPENIVPTLPSSVCENIQISYEVKVELIPDAVLSSNLVLTAPIVIGSTFHQPTYETANAMSGSFGGSTQNTGTFGGNSHMEQSKSSSASFGGNSGQPEPFTLLDYPQQQQPVHHPGTIPVINNNTHPTAPYHGAPFSAYSHPNQSMNFTSGQHAPYPNVPYQQHPFSPSGSAPPQYDQIDNNRFNPQNVSTNFATLSLNDPQAREPRVQPSAPPLYPGLA